MKMQKITVKIMMHVTKTKFKDKYINIGIYYIDILMNKKQLSK